jgi:hypothetical protein
MRLPRRFAPRNDGEGKIQIPLTPFSKGGDWFLSLYFHPHLVMRCSMTVYHVNQGINEK